MIEGEAPVSPGQASTEDADEARRRWEGIHNDECWRDVHGTFCTGGKDDVGCVLRFAAALGIPIVIVALGVYLLVRLVF